MWTGWHWCFVFPLWCYLGLSSQQGELSLSLAVHVLGGITAGSICSSLFKQKYPPVFEWDWTVTGAWLNSSQVSLECGSLAEHLPYVPKALGLVPSTRRKREGGGREKEEKRRRRKRNKTRSCTRGEIDSFKKGKMREMEKKGWIKLKMQEQGRK